MQAVVLAAGFGRRMAPISRGDHKALLPIAGTTILGRILDALEGRVERAVVVTGHRAADIEAFVATRGARLPVDLVHNARYAETNNVVSLSLALEEGKVDDDLLVIECDLLFDPAILEPLLAPNAGNVALVDRWRLGMDGTVVSVHGGIVTSVWPTHLQDVDFDYADKYKTLNIYRFDRGFCDEVFRPLLSCYASLVDGNAFYELVLGMLVNMQRHPIRAAIVDGDDWAEVDDPNDLRTARFTFEPEARPALLERAFGGLWNYDVLDFNLMRNSYFPTGPMLAAMRHALPELVRHYGSAQTILNEKLSWFLDCDAARVQVAHGASQLIPILGELLAPRSPLVPDPTFGEWSAAFPGADTYRDDPGVDLDALDAAAAAHDLVVVVNPNNPTGTCLPTGWLHALAARHPGTTFVVDESFVDFAGVIAVQSLVEADARPNVVVVKSLGKALGTPGLRLGYLHACDDALVRAVGERLPVWNLSAPAEFLLELLLKHRPDLDASFERTVLDREALRSDLAALACVDEVHPSAGNFLLLRLAAPVRAVDVRDRLLVEERVHVKALGDRFPTGEWLRVGVRTPADNRRLVDALGRAGRA